jgi:S-adenosylmethionine hydrolase
MLEKRFKIVAPQLFAVNGGADGTVTVPDTSLFKVKQQVIVVAASLINQDQLEVKNIISPTQMLLGLRTTNIFTGLDLSAYTTALGAFVFANEQKRPVITADDFERACFEEEPVVAKRVIMVDKWGNRYDSNNPVPTVTAGDNWDEIDMTRDTDGDLTIATYSLDNAVEKVYTITYDVNKDMKKVVKT